MLIWTNYATIFLAVISTTFILLLGQCDTLRSLSSQERIQYKQKIESMFYHAYDSYLTYATDFDELMPISCSGMDTWGTFSLSLIDALDTLIIVGNYSEFRRVAQHIIDTASFETNTNVSVFETNIRVIGGLLSAHLFQKRAGMEVEEGWPCSGPLLRLAENVARKILPAFDTPTGMPYGTINFLHGVPENETPVTCTAGVGTFIVEFGALSRLTGDPIFEQKALNALDALQKYRSKIGLLGNHINVLDGKWTATEAGIGAGVDSYYEYLVKGAIMLQNPSLIDVFYYDYELIKNYMKKNDWYVWVSMTSGSATMPIFQSLESFFPGTLTLIGEIDQAKKSLYNYHQIWKQYGFVPEFYDIVHGKLHKREGYPLRPEFIESVLYLYQATKDPHLLMIGADVVDSIYHSARTECGYATIKSVSDHTIEDRMESFFLSETLKYLYLLFDEDNFMHNKGSSGTTIKRRNSNQSPEQTCTIDTGGYVFNTEAHPIDIAALSCCHESSVHSTYSDHPPSDSVNFYDDIDFDTKRFQYFENNINMFDLLSFKKYKNAYTDMEVQLEEEADVTSRTESIDLLSVPKSSISSLFTNFDKQTKQCSNENCDKLINSIISTSKQIEPSFSANFHQSKQTLLLLPVSSATVDLIQPPLEKRSISDSSNNNDPNQNGNDALIETIKPDLIDDTNEQIAISSINQPATTVVEHQSSTESPSGINSAIKSNLASLSQTLSSLSDDLRQKLEDYRLLLASSVGDSDITTPISLESVSEDYNTDSSDDSDSDSEQQLPEWIRPNYELLSCPSQSFLSRLSLYGQVFD